MTYSFEIGMMTFLQYVYERKNYHTLLIFMMNIISQGRRNWSGQSGHGLTSSGSLFFKSSSQCTEKCYNFISIFILVKLFLIYLRVVHNMGLEKFWLTQGLPLLDTLLDHNVFDYWISWPSKLLGYFRIIVWHERDIYYCS